MGILLYRIDDRLIHGQVVVGWGQPFNVELIILVDDGVATCDWECDLYRMGVPPEMEIAFAGVSDAIARHAEFASDPRPSILVTGDIDTMQRLAAGVPDIRDVNVGGIHQSAGRVERLRYVFLTPDEEVRLRELAATGVNVTAQDVPSASPVPLGQIIPDAPPGAAKAP